jgi:predicted peptidase
MRDEFQACPARGGVSSLSLWLQPKAALRIVFCAMAGLLLMAAGAAMAAGKSGKPAPARSDSAKAQTGVLRHQRTPGYTNETAWYHIAIPKDYDPRKPAALIIYLHGGHHNAGTADSIVALAEVLPTFKKHIVLFPNHLQTWWAHPREMTHLLAVIKEAMRKWKVNPKRIYLMGGSMGGNGVWAVGSQWPEMFAGLSPIGGWYAGNLGFPLANLKAKPIYVLHGAKDQVVPIGGARQAVELLKKEGANIVMRECDSDHQPPNDEIGKAADWILQYENKQVFDMAEIEKRVAALPVPGWLANMK